MDRILNWSLWGAGVLALLGALGIADLTFSVLFLRIDALIALVGLICLANAYRGSRVP